ncbi:uncharacterized protein RJT21DRAFT_122423 [Scheffersomyces amazonensis]|uniref:uncharacterized protein n=1 Tax=Scheffersomyces amazonensis TaxID=1078765 RepID=UPI00315DF3DF
MNFYYRKSMGNGTIASKFRLENNIQPPIIQSNQSNLRNPIHSHITSTTTLPIGSGYISTVAPQSSASTLTSTSTPTSTSGSTSGSTSISNSIDSSIPTNNGHTTGSYHTLDEKEQSIITGALMTNKRSFIKSTENDDQKNQPVEFPDTHHPNNCNRCYRLKKKCSREYPKCSNCSRTGNECEYIHRSNKRRKRIPGSKNIKYLGENTDANVVSKTDIDVVSDGKSSDEVISEKISEQKPIVLKESNEISKQVHKLVSVSSLLSTEEEEVSVSPSSTTTAITPSSSISSNTITSTREPRPKKVPSAALSSSARRAKEADDIPEHEKLIRRLWTTSNTNLKEEFITMKSISDPELPLKFVRNYFDNFSHKYPFIDKMTFLSTFNNIDFTKESIINLDTYLLMASGCLIADSTNKDKRHFQDYFNEKNIASIIDVLNLNISYNDRDEIVESLKLLLLLTVYSLTSLNYAFSWSLIGILDRLIVHLDLYKKSDNVSDQRIFWSIYNLDKELSLLAGKPSQIPINDFIQVEFPLTKTLYEDENLQLINQEIKLSHIRDTLLYLKLSGKKNHDLKSISSELEQWRIDTSSAIHQGYSQAPNMPEFISITNLNYYYLLVELDQLSLCESFQFTLQFISNSFHLFVSEAKHNDKKQSSELSLNAYLMWHIQLSKVIQYNLNSLLDIFKDNQISTIQISVKLSEVNSNLQVIINLLNYLQEFNNVNQEAPTSSNDEQQKKIDINTEHLQSIHKKLITFNVMTSNLTNRLELAQEIGTVVEQIRTI